MLSLKDSNFLVKQIIRAFGWIIKRWKGYSIIQFFLRLCKYEHDEEVWSVFCSNTKTKLRPDRTKMLNATYLGGVLELFDLMIIVLIIGKDTLYLRVKYGIAEGAIPKYVVFNETTQIGLRTYM
ncbi:MAG: hypothetical protein ACLRTD_27500 [Bacteroides sp.]